MCRIKRNITRNTHQHSPDEEIDAQGKVWKSLKCRAAVSSSLWVRMSYSPVTSMCTTNQQSPRELQLLTAFTEISLCRHDWRTSQPLWLNSISTGLQAQSQEPRTKTRWTIDGTSISFLYSFALLSPSPPTLMESSGRGLPPSAKEGCCHIKALPCVH